MRQDPSILVLLCAPAARAASDLGYMHTPTAQGGLFAAALVLFCAVVVGAQLKGETSESVTVQEAFAQSPPAVAMITEETLPAVAPPPAPPTPPTLDHAKMDGANDVSSSPEALRLLEAEQRLLAAFGYEETEETDAEISADDIAAFEASHGQHRRTPSGGVKRMPVQRYKDRANSEPLCDIVSRWQAKDAKESPTSPQVVSPRSGKGSPLPGGRAAQLKSSKRQKHHQLLQQHSNHSCNKKR